MPISTRILLLGCSFMLLINPTFSQNLVVNPSFETYSACPSGVAQLSYATGWTNVSGHSGSADYMNVCGSGWADVPSNAFGSQAPATGEGYAGLAIFYQTTANFREYVQTQLSAPLVAGVTYEVSVKVSLSDNSSHASNTFSAYFGNSALTWGGGGWGPITTVTPQADFSTYVPDFTSWTTLTSSFTALGGEQFMVFGNFRNDASTPQTFVHSATYSTGYYYIDDFVVQAITVLPLELLSFSGHKTSNQHVRLNWNVANSSSKGDFEIQRSKDGREFGTIGKVAEGEFNDYFFDDLAPFEGENYYRLKQIDVNGEISYSNIINVTFDVDDSNISIAPNPVNDVCTVYLGNIASNTNMYLMDLSGKTLRNYEVFANSHAEMQLDLSEFASGMYFLFVPNKTSICIAKK